MKSLNSTIQPTARPVKAKSDAGKVAAPSRNSPRRRRRPVIAHRKLRDGEYPRQAQGFDKETYRRRNVVERLIGRLKEFRSIALIRLAFSRIWMKDLLVDRA
jgi:transposase